MAIFRSFWHGAALSPYEQLCMKSFVDHGHHLYLYSYTSDLEVPRGVDILDAEQIVPRSDVFVYRQGLGKGSVAAFSNLFRYELLYRFGDWWVDSDVVCLSDRVPEREIFLGWEDDEVIGSAILKFPQGHSFVRELIRAARLAGTDVQWGDTGPFLITGLAKDSDLGRAALPSHLCYPVSSRAALDIFLPSKCAELSEKIEGLSFLHIWNEVLRRAVVFKWMAPPANSLVATLFAKHSFLFNHALAYTADDMERLQRNYCGNIQWEWFKARQESTLEHLTEVAAGRLDTIQQLERQIQETEGALRRVTALSLERLAEIERLDSRLKHTDEALAAVTSLAIDRLREMERLERRVNELQASVRSLNRSLNSE